MSAFDILEAAKRVSERRKWRCVSNRLEDIQHAPHYSEPGYSTKHDAILFGNWNDPCGYTNRDRTEKKATEESAFFAGVVKALEACAELEWSDEWCTCCDCDGAVRTSGDSYGWQRSYVELGGETLCRDCAKKHPEDVLEEFIGSESRCLTDALGLDLSALGFVKLDQRFENGLYGGQDADPKKIARALCSRGVVFHLDDVGQFDVKFSVWVHAEEIGKITDPLTHAETACALDPAEGLKRALQSIPIPPGEGITYAKCDVSTGTSTARKVSPQEFIDGIKD